MKKTLAALLVLVTVFALLPTSALAKSSSESIAITYCGISIAVDGNKIVPADANGNSVEPFIYNGTTYLPVRAVASALGLTVRWSSLTSTVYLRTGGEASTGTGTAPATYSSKSITVYYDNIKLSVGGKTITPRDASGTEVEPFIYNDTTYLPVRAIASALDVNVGWDGGTNTVYLGEQPEGTAQAPVDNSAAVGIVSDPGKVVSNSAGNVKVDYSGADLGIVRVSTVLSGGPKTCIIITTPTGTQYKYFYTDTTGAYEDFILPDGSGTYKVAVYKNVSGTSYSTLYSTSFKASISDALQPFLRSNFYVEYTSATKCVGVANYLCASLTDELDKVSAIYYYVVNNYTYDYDKANSVQSGYRPDLDEIYSLKKGICFDYASMMVAMLRSQGVPAKLVIGYAGTAYHAWINVYTKESGWIEAVIYFNGDSWKLMDPTYASTGNNSRAILEYINNPDNYDARFVY